MAPSSDNPILVKAVPGLYAMGIRASQGATSSTTEHSGQEQKGSIQGDEVNAEAGRKYGWLVTENLSQCGICAARD